MQVIVAPVSIKAGNVLISMEDAVAGVNAPVGDTPMLISAPMETSNFPLRHGIGEKSQVYWGFDDFLN